MSILEGKGLCRRYRKQNRVIEALRGVDFHLEKGEILYRLSVIEDLLK